MEDLVMGIGERLIRELKNSGMTENQATLIGRSIQFLSDNFERDQIIVEQNFTEVRKKIDSLEDNTKKVQDDMKEIKKTF